MKIDKNIPPPTRRHNKYSEMNEAVRKMKDKDSIFVKTCEQRESARGTLSRNGFKVITKRENDGYRIWAISK